MPNGTKCSPIDPAPQCAKGFSVTFSCGASPPVIRTDSVGPEAGGQTVVLGCSAPPAPPAPAPPAPAPPAPVPGPPPMINCTKAGPNCSLTEYGYYWVLQPSYSLDAVVDHCTTAMVVNSANDPISLAHKDAVSLASLAKKNMTGILGNLPFMNADGSKLSPNWENVSMLGTHSTTKAALN